MVNKTNGRADLFLCRVQVSSVRTPSIDCGYDRILLEFVSTQLWQGQCLPVIQKVQIHLKIFYFVYFEIILGYILKNEMPLRYIKENIDYYYSSITWTMQNKSFLVTSISAWLNFATDFYLKNNILVHIYCINKPVYEKTQWLCLE